MAPSVHILTHEFSPFRGGIGVYAEETARAAVASGMKVTVWAPDYGQRSQDAFPFEVRRIAMRGKQDWLCRLKMAFAMRKAFPDGKISGTLILAEPGPLRLWFYRKWVRLPSADRLAVVFHGSELRKLTRHRRHCARLRELLQEVDFIGVVSEAVETELLSTFPEFRNKTGQIPGAVRSTWANQVAKQENSSDGTLTLLQVGRIHPRKGQLTLAHAVKLIPENLRRRVRVRLVGPESKVGYADAVRQYISSNGLPIRLEGNLSEAELRRAYESATLCLMPSQAAGDSVEGLGLALLEAQHFGTPVLATRIGGIPQAVNEGVTGLLVPPDDPVALMEAIVSLLEDPDRTREMGQAGREFVRDSFSWERNVAQLCGHRGGISATDPAK